MPFDSEGNFTRIHSWEEDRENDLDIMSDRMDEEDDNFMSGFNNCMLRDGRCTMTGDLKMGNFKVKNIANGTISSDAVNKGQLDEGIKQINALAKIPLEEKPYASTIQLSTNKAYYVTMTGGVNFTLPSVSGDVFNQIVCEIWKKDASYNIGLGTDAYFGSEAPYLSEAGYYTIIWEYDQIRGKWVVGAIKK